MYGKNTDVFGTTGLMGHVTHFNKFDWFSAAIKPVVQARAAIVVSGFQVYAKAFKVVTTRYLISMFVHSF